MVLMQDVFLVQPIHRAGTDRLQAAGFHVRQATGSDMATVAGEIGGAHAVVTRNAGLSAAAMAAAPRLRLVVVHGVGYDPVDVAHATAHGILVCNTPSENAESVAEHAIGLVMALARQTIAGDRAVRRGTFEAKYRLPIAELRGKTLGIVGCGRTGTLTAAMARRGFRMRVLGYSPSRGAAVLRRLGIEPCRELGRLLEQADVVSLHVPLRPETRGLVGRPELARMKPGAFLVNTARGALVDEEALVAALASRHLGGAGLDVFAEEPLAIDHPLLGLDNVVLSPHVAGSSEEALARTALAVARAVAAMARGRRPTNVINPPDGRVGARRGR